MFLHSMLFGNFHRLELLEHAMHISIITFDGFNELDSLIVYGILNRIKQPGWRVTIAGSEKRVSSMNGLVLESQVSLLEASSADAVIIGSGIKTREVASDLTLMAQLTLDPNRQLLASQCSGALIMAKLGLLAGIPVCTDLTTKPWVEETGVEVLDQPFFTQNNIASAGGCLASIYLAAWIIARSAGTEAAESAIRYVAPVGEKDAFVALVMNKIH